MYKIIILGIMCLFSFAEDLNANSPWEPRLEEGKPDGATDGPLPSEQAEESHEADGDPIKEDAE